MQAKRTANLSYGRETRRFRCPRRTSQIPPPGTRPLSRLHNLHFRKSLFQSRDREFMRHFAYHILRHAALTQPVPLKANVNWSLEEQGFDLTSSQAGELDPIPALFAAQIGRVDIGYRTSYGKPMTQQITYGCKHASVDCLIRRVIGQQLSDRIGRKRMRANLREERRFAGPRQADRQYDALVHSRTTRTRFAQESTSE